MKRSAKFSEICGENVRISEGKSEASWDQRYSGGIVFSDRPLRPSDSKLRLQLDGCSHVDIGVTLTDPNSLRRPKQVRQLYLSDKCDIINSIRVHGETCEVFVQNQGNRVVTVYGEMTFGVSIDSKLDVWLIVCIKFGNATVTIDPPITFHKVTGENIEFEGINKDTAKLKVPNPAAICVIDKELTKDNPVRIRIDPMLSNDGKPPLLYHVILGTTTLRPEEISTLDPQSLSINNSPSGRYFLFSRTRSRPGWSPIKEFKERSGELTIEVTSDGELRYTHESGIKGTLGVQELPPFIVLELFRVSVKVLRVHRRILGYANYQKGPNAYHMMSLSPAPSHVGKDFSYCPPINIYDDTRLVEDPSRLPFRSHSISYETSYQDGPANVTWVLKRLSSLEDDAREGLPPHFKKKLTDTIAEMRKAAQETTRPRIPFYNSKLNNLEIIIVQIKDAEKEYHEKMRAGYKALEEVAMGITKKDLHSDLVNLKSTIHANYTDLLADLAKPMSNRNRRATLETQEVDIKLPELTCYDKEGAVKFIKAVKEGNLAVLQQFEEFCKSSDFEHFPVNPLIIIAAFGSSRTAECVYRWGLPTFNWNTRQEIPAGTLGGLLDKMKDRKATPLYVATFLMKVLTVESLIKYSDEQNLAYCMSKIQLETSMESVYMTEVGERLKSEYQELSPAVVPGHQREANDRLARVFIVYSPKVVHETNHMKDGIALVMIRNPYRVDDEAMIVSNSTDVDKDISTQDMERTKNAIESHSTKLWCDHSNLNMISVCSVRSKRKGDILEKCVCVVLYCSTKGVVPLGEKNFPSTLPVGEDDSIGIDVREGYFEFGGYPNKPGTIRHENLKMGCNIGALSSQNSGGTLGPFVQYEDTMGFLTCAHVLFDVAQQHHVDFIDDGSKQRLVVQPAADASPPFGSPCGFVHRAIFNPSMDISIDVAVVTISDETRIPSKGRFANDHSYKYKEAGFDELPEYNNGAILSDIRQFGTSNLVVKFGSETHLTKGYLRVDGTQVRPLSTALGLPSMAKKICMKNQYEVIGHRSGVNIFQPGDSGSAVFMLEGTSLHCIGLAIGLTTYGTAVVTPIQAILDALGSNADIKLLCFDD